MRLADLARDTLRRSAGALFLLPVLLLFTAPGAEPLSAQELEAGPRGWIGVGIRAHGECGPGSTGACGPAVVGSVILGGPADSAGIQPGDTLLAMGGREISRGPADPAFRQIRPGERLTVRVARSGRRLEIQLTPRTHPDSLAVVRLRRPPEPAPAGEHAPPPALAPTGYGLAVPDAVRRPEEPGPDPAVRAASEDREIAVVRVVPTGQAGELSRGLVHARQQELRQAMARARLEMARAREAARSEMPAAERLAREMELRAARRAAEEWRSWIDDSLKTHLDAIHDSVLSVARRQLEVMAEARSAARSARAAQLGSRDRIAGAELEGLSPELAEVFGGPGDGVLVLRVLAQTPAHELGLRPGDVIVEAAGQPLGSVDELRRLLQASGPEPVHVKWIRKGEEMTGRLAR